MTSEEQQKAIEAIKRSLEGRSPVIEILIVEDDEADAEITVGALEKFGLRVRLARNMAEVLRAIRESTPWLVFLDMKLSGDSGLNVLQILRDFRQDTRVVILTGAFEHDSQECKKALTMGAIAVMLKPLTEEQIQLIFGTPH